MAGVHLVFAGTKCYFHVYHIHTDISSLHYTSVYVYYIYGVSFLGQDLVLRDHSTLASFIYRKWKQRQTIMRRENSANPDICTQSTSGMNANSRVVILQM